MFYSPYAAAAAGYLTPPTAPAAFVYQPFYYPAVAPTSIPSSAGGLGLAHAPVHAHTTPAYPYPLYAAAPGGHHSHTTTPQQPQGHHGIGHHRHHHQQQQQIPAPAAAAAAAAAAGAAEAAGAAAATTTSTKPTTTVMPTTGHASATPTTMATVMPVHALPPPPPPPAVYLHPHFNHHFHQQQQQQQHHRPPLLGPAIGTVPHIHHQFHQQQHQHHHHHLRHPTAATPGTTAPLLLLPPQPPLPPAPAPQQQHHQEQKAHLAPADPALTSRTAFYAALKAFRDAIGAPIQRLPTLGFKELDLWVLYCQVIHRGGIDAVIAKKQWKEVAEALQLPSSCTDSGFRLRLHYKKYLEAYERRHFTPAKPALPVPAPSEATSSSTTQAAARTNTPVLAPPPIAPSVVPEMPPGSSSSSAKASRPPNSAPRCSTETKSESGVREPLDLSETRDSAAATGCSDGPGAPPTPALDVANATSTNIARSTRPPVSSSAPVPSPLTTLAQAAVPAPPISRTSAPQSPAAPPSPARSSSSSARRAPSPPASPLSDDHPAALEQAHEPKFHMLCAAGRILKKRARRPPVVHGSRLADLSAAAAVASSTDAPPTSPASSSSCDGGGSGCDSASPPKQCLQTAGPGGVDFSVLGRTSLLRYAKVHCMDLSCGDLEKLEDDVLAARVAAHFKKHSVETNDAVTEFIGAIRRR